ncbi:sigma factor-like helix-turn-helix DNA-binding protein [Synergistes jonesii]|uniref:sigma factor-like helix-turn-helix DNA-binding protein n=1 Tax=Synergistes jonesii TaxID=2754 RepID=UPI00248E0741|nr:sigma factor-like helix-turn-helix DNA-binding protein [Synergistes jonesii]
MATYRHRMVEGAIKDFPAIKKDYDGYKLMLGAQAMSCGCLWDEPVDGGGAVAAGDRYLERYNDPVMRKLSSLMSGIYEPYCGLEGQERRILALRYWRNMEVSDIARELGFTERHVYRLLNSALSRLYRPLLSVQSLLEDWRTGCLHERLRAKE